MTRSRPPRPHEIEAARQDPRLRAARAADPNAADWRLRGRCNEPYTDPEWFFPLPAEPAGMALSICSRCRVQPECLAAALDSGVDDGVWGATTPRERRPMLAAWRQLGGRIRQAVT